jgi:hypothetical protein
MLIGRWG